MIRIVDLVESILTTRRLFLTLAGIQTVHFSKASRNLDAIIRPCRSEVKYALLSA